MSDKREITIQVTQQEQMRIEAKPSATPGLVVHRQVRWAPGKEEHKFTSKWQVTHERSGRGLLTPSRCLPREKDALKFASRLEGVTEWETMSAEKMADDDDLLARVKAIYDGIMREQEDEESGQVVVDELYETRYYVENNRSTRRYEVRDAATGEVATDGEGQPLEFAHKGRAWKKAHELNEGG